MSTDSETFLMGGVCGMIAGSVFGWYLHLGMMSDAANGILQHQQTAIDAGHAEWVVDQKTGVRAFKWKTAPEMDWNEDEEEAPK